MTVEVEDLDVDDSEVVVSPAAVDDDCDVVVSDEVVDADELTEDDEDSCPSLTCSNVTSSVPSP